MVPHQETREATRRVVQCVPVTQTRTVCRDEGHWEEQPADCLWCFVRWMRGARVRPRVARKIPADVARPGVPAGKGVLLGGVLVVPRAANRPRSFG